MEKQKEQPRTGAMSYNVGASDYSAHRIQPWDIWEEYGLNPWDADIVKRVLRTKQGEDRQLDYEKIMHICQKRIEMLQKADAELIRSGYLRVKPCAEAPEAEVATATYEYTPEELDASSNWGCKIVLEKGGILPTRSTEGAAGYDLFAPTHYIIMPGRNVVPLAFRMEIPRGIGATTRPRSGFTLKGFEGYLQWEGNFDMNLDQLVPLGKPDRLDADVKDGLIDSDFRGVVGVLVYSREQQPFLLAKGTRFAQMCFNRYEEVDFHPVDRLSDTDRGEGGFNSTGTK